MFVCICNAVKESQIQQAIQDGCNTLDALKEQLDVATCCGGCEPLIEGYLAEAGQVELNNKSMPVYYEVA